jgi:hypothetical protein
MLHYDIRDCNAIAVYGKVYGFYGFYGFYGKFYGFYGKMYNIA